MPLYEIKNRDLDPKASNTLIYLIIKKNRKAIRNILENLKIYSLSFVV